MLLISLVLWATDYYNGIYWKHKLVLSAQAIFLLQLIGTFIVQIRAFNQMINSSDTSIYYDVFGLLLHNIQTYSVTNNFNQLTLIDSGTCRSNVSRYSGHTGI